MLTIEGLKEIGANTDEGLGRCLNNEAFYLRLVGMAAQDEHFSGLEQAIKDKDLDAFTERFLKTREYFGEFADVAFKESGSLLAKLQDERE